MSFDKELKVKIGNLYWNYEYNLIAFANTMTNGINENLIEQLNVPRK